jgi:hypothetical protein
VVGVLYWQRFPAPDPPPLSRRPTPAMHRIALTTVTLAVLAAGCGGSSSPTPEPSVVARTAPDLAAFLKLPVATPSSCPSNVSGSTSGRSSPWVGHVDVSVFLRPSVTTRQTLKLGNTLRADPDVQTAYFESSKQAYEEFQRLYTCWTSVPPSQTPASYRVVLYPTVTIGERNDLVARLVKQHDIDSISCNPTAPCTSIVAPSPTPSTS